MDQSSHARLDLGLILGLFKLSLKYMRLLWFYGIGYRSSVCFIGCSEGQTNMTVVVFILEDKDQAVSDNLHNLDDLLWQAPKCVVTGLGKGIYSKG